MVVRRNQNRGNECSGATAAVFAAVPGARIPMDIGTKTAAVAPSLWKSWRHVSPACFNTGLNPVREHLSALGSPEAAGAYIAELAGLAARLDRLFPDRFGPARKTLRNDIAWMKRSPAGRKGQ